MIEIIKAGLFTTVQDYPGRLGFWDIGLPANGPMDPLAFRIGNRLLGNPEGEAGLEMTAMGDSFRFHKEMRICFTGAKMIGKWNGKDVPWNTPFEVSEGDEINLSAVEGAGMRSYLTVAGGIDVPSYLGSKSTFPLAKYGGYEGRTLQRGDVLKVGKPSNSETKPVVDPHGKMMFVPEYSNEWEIGVLPGPHYAPDCFTEEFVEEFFNTTWTMNYNSSRLGCRLDGPVPTFTRTDGGPGGSHPSNIIDYPYAMGAINFTGTLPVILGVDQMSMGGFICMVTVAEAEFWKVGQARPNDKIKFIKLTYDEAVELKRRQDEIVRMIG